MKLNLLVLRTSRLEDMRTFYSALGARFEKEREKCRDLIKLPF